jgi:proton-translocating NADH-quinone oxidoreductase chain M
MKLALNYFDVFFTFVELISVQVSGGFFLFVLFSPLFGIFFIFFIKNTNVILIKNIGFICSLITFFFSLFLWIVFDINCTEFQFYITFFWLNSSLINLEYIVGIDGISIFFLLLTTFLIPLCILISWTSIKFRIKEFILCLLFIEFFLLNFFSVLDLILFYVYFESVLIPMFLLIGIWGSRNRKIHAAYQFFLYTLLGSVLLLLGILVIYFQLGTTDIQVFLNASFSKSKQLILWIAFFFPFAVKVPMIPVHIWLPEAHVEAPTAGSVLLAGVLLKLGTYGLLRFVIPVLSYANYFFTPLVFSIALISIIYSSCTTIRQIDLKKL